MVDDKVVDLQTQLLEPQLNIGKAVIESMLEMYYRDGVMKGVVILAPYLFYNN